MGQRVAKLGAPAALACRFLLGLIGAHFESGCRVFGQPAVGEEWVERDGITGITEGKSLEEIGQVRLGIDVQATTGGS